jgi:hypothetical protein
MPANESWFADQIKSLQRQITELRAARTLEASTIGAGGITIQAGGALVLKDANGATLVKLDSAGLHQYDEFGNLVASMGLLNGSPAIYGLGVAPEPGAALQQVRGVLSSTGLGVSGVSTGGSNVTFPGASTVTAVIGPSGNALIGGSFEIDPNNNGMQGGVIVSIDSGASFIEVARLQIVGTFGSYIGGSSFVWGGMTPGTHTFTAQYYTQGTGTCDLSGDMYVQPL